MTEKLRSARIAVLAALAAATITTAAAQGTFSEERVHFARGTHGTAVQGQVSRDEAVVYVIGAKAGQAMTVQLDGDAKTSFDVAGPKDGAAQAMASGETEWSGKLPDSGDYRILVLTQSRVASPFTLRLTID